jgi:lipid-binding SYLF domain-containing protein
MKLLLTALVALAPLAAQDKEPAERLTEAAAVFSEIMAATDTSIPQDLLTDAHCIVIVPGLKTAAFVFGGKFGKGYLSCRKASGGGWSAPGTVRIEGGSVGFQIGGSSTDLIMLVMSERGADKLLSSKFTLGAEGSVAAGPVGRTATAQTDAQMKADILSWSRSQGLFAGVALEGATLRQDLDDNETLYGKRLENREIVTTSVPAPKAAGGLLALLNKHSAREGHGITSSAGRLEAKKASPSHAKENRSAMDRGEIKQMQESLNDKGFDVGPADGVMGRRTRAGIRAFQKAENLPVTGRLDAATAAKLGVGAESLVGKL